MLFRTEPWHWSRWTLAQIKPSWAPVPNSLAAFHAYSFPRTPSDPSRSLTHAHPASHAARPRQRLPSAHPGFGLRFRRHLPLWRPLLLAPARPSFLTCLAGQPSWWFWWRGRCSRLCRHSRERLPSPRAGAALAWASSVSRSGGTDEGDGGGPMQRTQQPPPLAQQLARRARGGGAGRAGHSHPLALAESETSRWGGRRYPSWSLGQVAPAATAATEASLRTPWPLQPQVPRARGRGSGACF